MHGLAQREGAITSHVRYQKEVFEDERKNLQSSIISYGDADLYICFEPIEALRRGIFASEKTTFVINDRDIPSVMVTADLEEYPSLERIREILEGYSKNVFFLNATDLSLEMFKTNKFVNIIMLGYAIVTEKIPFIEISHYEEVIREWLSDPELNIQALHLGINEAKKSNFQSQLTEK